MTTRQGLNIRLSVVLGGLSLLVTSAWGPAAAQPAGLKTGEYTCFGSGGRALMGLGFKVQAGGRYTDLDGGNSGTYSVNRDQVIFRGGHLDG